jgi:hypothetical protein
MNRSARVADQVRATIIVLATLTVNQASPGLRGFNSTSLGKGDQDAR